MLVLGEIVFVVQLLLLIYCLLNIITTPEDQVRHLPKLLWLVLVVVLPLVGGIAWLAVGRPAGAGGRVGPKTGRAIGFPEYDRPGRAVAQHPDDDEEFLRGLRARAEEQRRRAAEGRTDEDGGPLA